MKKIALAVAALFAFGLANSAVAATPETVLTAYRMDAKGEVKKNAKGEPVGQAEVKEKGKVIAGKQIRVFTKAEFDKLSKDRQEANKDTKTYCGETYYLSKKDIDWIKAHEGAKNMIAVRDHVKVGTYVVLCPKVAAPAKAEPKKAEPKKTN